MNLLLQDHTLDRDVGRRSSKKCNAFSDFGASWLWLGSDWVLNLTHSPFMVSLKTHYYLDVTYIHHQSSLHDYITYYIDISEHMRHLHIYKRFLRDGGLPLNLAQIMSAVETKSPGVFTRGVREKFSSVGGAQLRAMGNDGKWLLQNGWTPIWTSKHVIMLKLLLNWRWLQDIIPTYPNILKHRFFAASPATSAELLHMARSRQLRKRVLRQIASSWRSENVEIATSWIKTV